MRRFLVVALGIVSVIILAASAHADGAGTIIFSQPDGVKISTVPLTIIGTETNTSGTFFVRQEPPNGEAVTIRLMTQLADKTGQQVSGASVNFTAQEPISGTGDLRSVDATTTGFTLPKDGTPVQVTVNVSNLQEIGTFTGTIIVYEAATPTKGPTLQVKRMAVPQLKWVGATNSGYALTADTAKFAYPFQIESLNNTTTLVSVTVNSFIGSNGVQIKPDWEVLLGGKGCTAYKSDQSFTLPGFQSATVQVTASLPLTGTYRSGLTLNYNKQKYLTDLTVTRRQPPLPVKVAGIETATAVRGLLRAADPQIWFNLTSTDAQTNTVITPTLASLSLVGANASLTQAKYDSVTVTEDPGETTSHLTPDQGGSGTKEQSKETPGEMISPLTPDQGGSGGKQQDKGDPGKTTSPSLTLGPGQTKRVILTVVDLKEPGEYQGTLQISGLDARPIERQIKILVRASWWVAALCILLGVLVSEIIRVLAKTVRPRLRQQMKLRLALQELESQASRAKELTDDEKEVLQRFASRLRSQYALATMGEDKDSDGLIKEIHDKLPRFSRWVELRRRIDTISPAELQARLRLYLEPIGARLAQPPVDEKMTIEEQIKAIDTELSNLKDKISAELKTAFLKQVTELQSKLDSWPGAPESAKTALTNSKSLADQEGKLSDAQEQFNVARQAYLQFLIQDLKAHLTANMPPGFNQQAWDDLKKRVESKLQDAETQADVDRATELFEVAYADYLRQAVQMLRREVSKRHVMLTDLAKKYQGDAAKLTELTATQDGLRKVDGITGRLDDASAKIARNELGNAVNAYNQAQTDLKDPDLIDKLNLAGVSMGAPPSAPAFVAAFLGIPMGAAVSEKPIESFRDITLGMPSVSALHSAQVLTELLLGVIALAVAVVLGLNLLYFNSPTWGGGAAYVLAVLWGLGLHQAAGQTFDGLTKFIDARSA